MHSTDTAVSSRFCHYQAMLTKRICIYTKDIQRITGRSERYARQLLENIRREYGKPTGGLVTVQEFCRYTKIQQQEVEIFIEKE